MVNSTNKKMIERQLSESIAEAKTFSDMAKAIVDTAAKYVLTDSAVNLSYRQEAEKRLSLMLQYCSLNEQPVAAYILIRILKESETNKELMNAFQYDYSIEFQHSVNLILNSILIFYNEIGGGDG